jgi:hypothetical protein
MSSDRIQLTEPWCSCLIEVMPDGEGFSDGLGRIRILKSCWAHEFVGPPGLGTGFRPDDIREYLHGSPLSEAVSRAVRSTKDGDTDGQ